MNVYRSSADQPGPTRYQIDARFGSRPMRAAYSVRTMSGALAFILLAAVDAGAQWPQFRGPNGSGVHEGGPLPIDFAPETSAWSTEVPFGRSSPVVFGDRIYLTASEGDDLLTLCFSRTDGALLWRHVLRRQRTDERVASLNDPASPTPVADGSGVYVFFPDYGLLALDPEGRERWKVPLGPFHVAYGMASSPILAGGAVVQACDQQKGSFLLAVDARTGQTRWRLERPRMREGWFTPAVSRNANGRPVVVAPGSARIDGIEAETGRTVWSFPASRAENLGVPLVDGSRVYVNIRGFPAPVFQTWDALRSDYDRNGDDVLSREEVRSNPSYYEGFSYADVDRDGRITEAEWSEMRNVGVGHFGLTAIEIQGQEALSAEVLWRVTRNLPYVPAALLYRGILYMVKSGGIVTAVDPATGAILKQARAADALGEYFASPVAGDGKVYVASEEGKIVVLRAGPDLEILEVNDFGEEIYATPALADAEIFVRTRARLYCFRQTSL